MHSCYVLDFTLAGARAPDPHTRQEEYAAKVLALTTRTTFLPANSTVLGILKGYDQLMNLVMDEVEEIIRGESPFFLLSALQVFCTLMSVILAPPRSRPRRRADPETGEHTDKTRALGLAVLRGTALTVINPADGFEQIAK